MAPSKDVISKKSILVADDHLLLLDTLKFAIEAGDYEVTTCQRGADVLTAVSQESCGFDLILLDVHMPDMTGMSSIIEIVEKAAPIPVVLLTGGVSDQFAHQALNRGVRGYIPKSTNLGNLCDILKVVLSGGVYAPANVLAAKPLGESLWGLSPREQSIGELLALGLTNKVIAFELGLSEPTVKMHIRSIFRKLGAANRTQVAAAFQENDLVVSGASRETIDRSARSITSSSPTEPKGRIQ